ncbi:hypothetical protein ACFL5G_02685 [Candidatus Margulisiibacteriota bacterium]
MGISISTYDILVTKYNTELEIKMHCKIAAEELAFFNTELARELSKIFQAKTNDNAFWYMPIPLNNILKTLGLEKLDKDLKLILDTFRKNDLISYFPGRDVLIEDVSLINLTFSGYTFFKYNET